MTQGSFNFFSLLQKWIVGVEEVVHRTMQLGGPRRSAGKSLFHVNKYSNGGPGKAKEEIRKTQIGY